jgi:hypothetical protein
LGSRYVRLASRTQKIMLAEMRAAGVRGLLIYCSDYKCSNWTATSGDKWQDKVRRSDLESRFVCQGCGQRGADVWPDFEWDKVPTAYGMAV